MATWRVHVVCKDNASAEVFKDRFYKKLLNQSGTKVSFEVPGADEKGADEIVAAAKADGHTAEKEQYEDPLESSGASADFW